MIHNEFIWLLLSLATGGGCTLGDLRLMGGTNTMEGRVEICIDGVWGTISDDGWSTVDAQIACRQLGFAAAGTIGSLRQSLSSAHKQFASYMYWFCDIIFIFKSVSS